MWTGFYVGLNAGYGWDASPNVYTSAAGTKADIESIFVVPPPYIAADALSATSVASARANGFIGGGQAGYNYQWGNNFVVGLEADIQGAGIRGRGGFLGLGSASVDFEGATFTDNVVSTVEHRKTVDWLGTVRGRLGYLVTPTLLAFATGGLAYGGVTADTTIAQSWAGNDLGPLLQTTGGAGHYSNTRVGWTVGGGLEWMFAPNISVKAEYLYYDLGSATWGSGPASTSFTSPGAGTFVDSIVLQSRTRFDGHIARAGVNYHFNWGAPVVAGY
jgi:outer membrane immunogenic protein